MFDSQAVDCLAVGHVQAKRLIWRSNRPEADSTSFGILCERASVVVVGGAEIDGHVLVHVLVDPDVFYLSTGDKDRVWCRRVEASSGALIPDEEVVSESRFAVDDMLGPNGNRKRFGIDDPGSVRHDIERAQIARIVVEPEIDLT